MSKELILKKLDQLRVLLTELEQWLETPADDFLKNIALIRAAERNFELIVETASDINAQLLIERGKQVPDSYRKSFEALALENTFDHATAEKLIESAKLRNILVHEYDFDEDYKQFYLSAREMLPAYRDYLADIAHTIKTAA
ncbi:MAG: DUF86 domain-containing protein [bacterium]|nr:DUF86 domain-containing protein [bacterium]MDZ4295971.1 DUF86 domain-containing protein [Patescibacteria group bacterium]